MFIKMKEIIQNKKWKKQRAERGFSDYDIYEINTWFLNIIPKMLEEYIKVNNGIPNVLINEYYEDQSIDPKTISEEEEGKIDNICFEKWNDILKEMKQAFIEANENTCSYKNKYEEEYNRYLKNKYEEEYNRYLLKDESENNKSIIENYFSENKKIEEYIKENRKKAFELFVKYFDDLWW